jgi:endonuclease/exonuclease/phosphatase family metal-dependent hydrolase
VRLLVRTWNVFHGNANPPERHAFLEEMVRLASADEPDVLCLQELPVWSLSRLEHWSGMAAVSDVAARPLLPPELGREVTDLHHGLLRSAFTGQANAILLGARVRLRDHRAVTLNPWSFRRREARRRGLGLVSRLMWARERRVCQVVRVEEGGKTLVGGNLHATTGADKRLADAELLRAATFVDGFAAPGEAIVLAGDFNLTMRNSHTLAELQGPEWGFRGASSHGIDHILVRGAEAGPLSRWPDERRRFGGRLLSDHAPEEREVVA